jgi:hypothetical protein
MYSGAAGLLPLLMLRPTRRVIWLSSLKSIMNRDTVRRRRDRVLSWRSQRSIRVLEQYYIDGLVKFNIITDTVQTKLLPNYDLRNF